MAAPRTDARYDRGRIEAVPHGRVAAPGCPTHMCHHVHAADQRDLHLALPQTNDHSTVPNVLALETYGLVKHRCSCTAHDP